ncbi:MAG: PP2C family serine/threonine-protein phosphatase [Planctomycetota bacterium]
MSESLLNWDDYLQVASLSDVGMRRSNNQDNLCISLASSMDHWQRKGHVFIVADGMGAHAAGELASKLAIDQIPHLYAKYNDGSPPGELKKAVESANAEIHRRGQVNEEFFNMGTTCSVLSILPQGAVVAHIGDSRVYRYSQNRLEQLTFDHSLVWEMRAAGQLTAEEEEAGKVPKNVITRSLGPYPECKVDLEGPFPVQVGDTFLLCSDGLTGVVTDDEIGSILGNMSPNEAAKVLVDLANLRGGPDNITVIVVKITHPQMAGNPKRGTVSTSKGSETPIAIWPWIVLAICVLLGVVLFVVTNFNWQIAAIPVAVGLGFMIYGIIQAFSGGGPAVKQITQPLGKGPYIRSACQSGQQFAKQLAEMIDKIEAGARDQGWKVDWDQLKKLTRHAETAAGNQDHSSSIRSYGRAVSFLMDQLRNQTDSSNSSIEL